MKKVNIHYAKTHLSKLIRKSLQGEEVIIAKNNTPVVKLENIKAKPQKRRLGSAKGKISIASDFDKPLDDFKEYME